MEQNYDINSLKKKMLRKYPAFGSTINSVNYQVVGNNHQVSTAATDGETIYINADFMKSLTEQEQVFVFSHEVCHIALNHIMRSKNKDEHIWNRATDAVINQYLQKDGLPLVEGTVNLPEALNYDAEELYEKLLKEQNQNKNQDNQQNQQQQNNQNNQQNNEQKQEKTDNQCKNGACSQKGQGGSSNDKQTNNSSQTTNDNELKQNCNKQVGHDSHSMWKDVVNNTKKKQTKENKEQKAIQEEKIEKVSERDIFNQNEQIKIKKAEDIMSKINSQRRGYNSSTVQEVVIGDIGSAGNPVTNWKKLLIKSLELEDEAWGHKFSDKASGYTARIEDVEYDENAETEIILDTSGSVSVELLKNFLRQTKTILKNSTIQVGTFSNQFYGWTDIKKESDIDNLKLKVGGGTNFDAASTAFTKRKNVNKICFTDGQDGGNAGIKNKRKDIIWISFENPNFKPDNGKVIFIPKNIIKVQNDKEAELTR